jgi:guanylate kinase
MRPLVISGPSGVGKGTLIRLLFDRNPGRFAFSVSHTTRAPRPTEADGVHYHFVSRAAFDDLVARDAFVEHARFGAHSYGTSKAALLGRKPALAGEDETSAGPVAAAVAAATAEAAATEAAATETLFPPADPPKIIVLDIEMEGVKQVRCAEIPARFVFVAPPSFEELERRLRGRGTEREDSIQARLNQGRLEMEYAQSPGVHDKIIVNEDLEAAYAELEEFVNLPAPAPAA